NLAHFSILTPPPPRSTLFPYTTLFRSLGKQLNHLRISRAFSVLQREWAGLVSKCKERPKNQLLRCESKRCNQNVCVTWRIELTRSEEHTSELQSRGHLVCRLLLEKKKN